VLRAWIFLISKLNTMIITDHFDKCLSRMNKNDATLKSQGRMDAFLMKASASMSSKHKAGAIVNSEADTSKEDFDGADATLAEK